MQFSSFNLISGTFTLISSSEKLHTLTYMIYNNSQISINVQHLLEG